MKDKYCNKCAHSRAGDPGSRCYRPMPGVDVVTGTANTRQTDCYSERSRAAPSCGMEATYYQPRNWFMRWFT
jgi:hypothetical protein